MQNKSSTPWQLSKNERFGISLLFTLLVIFIIMPWLYRTPFYIPNKQPFTSTQAASSLNHPNGNPDLDTSCEYSQEKLNRNFQQSIQPSQSELFFFDPNQLNEGEAIRLGLSHHAFSSLQRYLETGAKITSKEQFRRIYGIDKQLYDKLENYISIVKNPKFNHGQNATKSKYNRIKRIDLNSASSEDLVYLPSIGERLASRIIKYRDLLGGFASINQLREVYGLHDSVIQKLIPMVYLEKDVEQLKLNQANSEFLSRHPYIGKFKARMILGYKQQHGNFNTLNELLKVPVLDSIWLEKVKPYLSIEY